MIHPRPYQQRAADAAIAQLKASTAPIIIDAAPAAGKSFLIAMLAAWLHGISNGKRVLCLAPSATLVTQNVDKYRATGEPCSIFSASAGAKSTRHPVVYATPLTVRNSISRFLKGFCAVVIDECHEITPTIKAIIEKMREANHNLRVIGLSGTPFRLGSGYIFREWPDGKTNGDDKARDPYFAKCVYQVSAREMLDQGFITPMEIGAINTESYDVSGLHLLPNGHWDSSDIERAFVGHGRKTAAIVADVINQSRNRPGGIMYFAATVQHAKEILASLPVESSAMVTGNETILFGEPVDEKRAIQAYRDRKVRHLISVGKLTTGFDVSHTETIATLRKTESAALLQQILGRAWRLDGAKQSSVWLDYAGNHEAHFPDGDIYKPFITAKGATAKGDGIEAECPDCGYANNFSLHKDRDGYQFDKHGYALDVFGERVVPDLPVHYGRRCMGMVNIGRNEYDRCNYRWAGKECPQCQEVNDIAARYCYVCRAEIVDPNEKLASDFRAMKKDPTQPQTDKIIAVEFKECVSQRGNATIRADWKTPWRQFSTWHSPQGKKRFQVDDWNRFSNATEGGKAPPETISYVKDADTGFFRVLAYNHPEDALQ